MDIFEHIKKEHKEQEEMLKQLTSKYNVNLFEKLSLALTAHMEAEERTLYTAMSDQEKEMVEHSIEEHRRTKMALDQLDRHGRGQGFYNSLSQLSQIIREHVNEEESKVLPTARDLFDDIEIDELSKRFDELDSKIMEREKQ